jgi:hypothetical protein
LINNLNRKEKYLIGLVIIICIASLYIRFFFIPTYKQINESKVAIDKYKTTQAKETMNKIELNRTKEIKDLSISLPDVERNSEIAYNIKIMMDKCLIELDKLTFGDITLFEDGKLKNGINLKGKLFAIPLSIVITGSYSNLDKFIKLLEGDKRFCEITEINVSHGILDQMIASMGLHYFYFEAMNKVKTKE